MVFKIDRLIIEKHENQELMNIISNCAPAWTDLLKRKEENFRVIGFNKL